ncbi:hypothetical protein JRC04_18085 [Mycolicibacterium sp. S2-37]|uniref:hypothetical protein n=1 Tax=Mycolicibacterium sp. S2-37 TaxID=2810297 RepID=UPI001A95182E|nr:hypothetical protein [Mycolicibacterium sp. S2-37]MBO0679378.1 hypothetical protein [Mycolicibacterium sp. S2-37]
MTTGPGPPYPPYPPYPHQPQQPPRKISVGMVFVGAPLYIVMNSLIGFGAFVIAGRSAEAVGTTFAVTAGLLFLIAFGGGSILLVKGSPHGRGIGLGLMVGWALTSLVTVGICTGINPMVYQ